MRYGENHGKWSLFVIWGKAIPLGIISVIRTVRYRIIYSLYSWSHNWPQNSYFHHAKHTVRITWISLYPIIKFVPRKARNFSFSCDPDKICCLYMWYMAIFWLLERKKNGLHFVLLPNYLILSYKNKSCFIRRCCLVTGIIFAACK